MVTRRSIVAAAAGLAAVFAGIAPAGAATVTYDLTGDAAARSTDIFGGNPAPAGYTLFLTDASTGLQQVQPVTLSVGDTIIATVSVTGGALTMPASLAGGSVDIGLDKGNTFIDYTESVSYYDRGVPVTPAGFTNDIGSGGGIDLGQASLAPSASFSFDKVVFNATVTGLVDAAGAVSSADYTAASPDLTVMYYPTPVPLPAAFWLFLSGVGGFRALVRRSQVSRDTVAADYHQQYLT